MLRKSGQGRGRTADLPLFRLPVVEPPGSKDLWGFCGARPGMDGHGACAGREELRQSSRNPAAIKSGPEVPRTQGEQRQRPYCSLSADRRIGTPRF